MYIHVFCAFYSEWIKMLYSKIRGKTERVESRHDRLDLNLCSHGNIVPPYHPFITMMQKTDHRKG